MSFLFAIRPSRKHTVVQLHHRRSHRGHVGDIIIKHDCIILRVMWLHIIMRIAIEYRYLNLRTIIKQLQLVSHHHNTILRTGFVHCTYSPTWHICYIVIIIMIFFVTMLARNYHCRHRHRPRRRRRRRLSVPSSYIFALPSSSFRRLLPFRTSQLLRYCDDRQSQSTSEIE